MNINKRLIAVFIFIVISEPVFSVDNNIYLDKNSEEYKVLLSILDENYYINPSTWESEKDFVKKYFSLAKNYCDQNEYEKAINNFVIICQKCTYSIVYYYLGSCLFDIGDYELSKSAFEKSIYAKNLWIIKDFTTFDTNGMVREGYYAYYNIACIESLRNNIESAYAYLCEALFHGYPYINYIKKDPDLKNLFAYNNGSYLKSMEDVYKAGSRNTVAGKAFALNWGGAPLEYHFVSKDFMYVLIGSVWPDPGGWKSASYTVKNYLIIANNQKYYYDEDDRFMSEQFIKFIKDFENLTERSEYKEIPLNKTPLK